MNPLVLDVFQKQMRALFWIYCLLSFCVYGAVVAVVLLGPPEMSLVGPRSLGWLEFGFGALSVLLLGLVVPWIRNRLLDPEKVRKADQDTFNQWGLPQSVDLSIGRQAIFLSRYSAGCTLSWILVVSVSFYGLVGRILLGASAWVIGSFLAAAVFAMIWLPPRSKWVREVTESF